MMLLTKELKEKLPELYSTENKDDPIVYARFFYAVSGWSWFPIEFDGEDTFFGFVDGDFPELGYFSLSELESIDFAGIKVERDVNFESKNLSEITRGALL